MNVVVRVNPLHIKDHSLFLKKFLRHGIAIASVAPSSRWLSEAVISNIDWEKVKVVVELGGGTGPITRLIAERAPASCTVVVIERDPDFADLLRKRFCQYTNFHVLQEDVRNLDAILAGLNITQVDHIISGLPSPSLPKDVRNAVFRVARQVLTPTGSFNNITEIPWYYKRWYRRHFDHVHFRFIPRNIPPGGVYYCRGVKGPL